MSDISISDILDTLLSLTREKKISWRLVLLPNDNKSFLPEEIIFSSKPRNWKINEEGGNNKIVEMVGCFYIGKKRIHDETYFFSMKINGKIVLSYTSNELESPFKLKALHDSVLYLHNSTLVTMANYVLREFSKDTQGTHGEITDLAQEERETNPDHNA